MKEHLLALSRNVQRKMYHDTYKLNSKKVGGGGGNRNSSDDENDDDTLISSLETP